MTISQTGYSFKDIKRLKKKIHQMDTHTPWELPTHLESYPTELALQSAFS